MNNALFAHSSKLGHWNKDYVDKIFLTMALSNVVKNKCWSRFYFFLNNKRYWNKIEFLHSEDATTIGENGKKILGLIF